MALPFISTAQTGPVSPYASNGIGSMQMTSDPVQLALGNSSFTLLDSTYLNFNNPASYSRISSGYPLFSLGLNGSYTQMKDGVNSSNSFNSYIDHFALAFPFAKRFGLAFGLTPYAKRNYSISTFEVLNTGDTMNYTYDGVGDISRVFTGLSINVVDNHLLTWSVGANFGHLFGSTYNERTSVLSGSASGGVNKQVQRMVAFDYDLATSLTWKVKKDVLVDFTGMYKPTTLLTTHFGNEQYYRPNIDEPASASNVVLDSTYGQGYVRSVKQYGLGLVVTKDWRYTTKKNRDKTSRLRILANHQFINYAGMGKTFDKLYYDYYYQADFERTSFGLEFTPDKNFRERSVTNTFFDNLTYRVGAYQDQLPYTVKNEAFKQFGTTFGFGIPILSQRGFSSVNLGFEIGQRTNGQVGAVNETFYGFKFGVIISPSTADFWFRKIKLD